MICAGAGIGIQAWLRAKWALARGGSNPLPRTNLNKIKRGLFFFMNLRYNFAHGKQISI